MSASVSFEQFQATRTWSDDLGKSLSDASLEGSDGQLYVGCLYIEAALNIEGATGPYVLTIGREQTFGELPVLEQQLYEWACSEGYCEVAA